MSNGYSQPRRPRVQKTREQEVKDLAEGLPPEMFKGNSYLREEFIRRNYFDPDKMTPEPIYDLAQQSMALQFLKLLQDGKVDREQAVEVWQLNKARVTMWMEYLDTGSELTHDQKEYSRIVTEIKEKIKEILSV